MSCPPFERIIIFQEEYGANNIRVANSFMKVEEIACVDQKNRMQASSS